jgi:hypothetical protein
MHVILWQFALCSPGGASWQRVLTHLTRPALPSGQGGRQSLLLLLPLVLMRILVVVTLLQASVGAQQPA